jgi:hypothetical protein
LPRYDILLPVGQMFCNSDYYRTLAPQATSAAQHISISKPIRLTATWPIRKCWQVARAGMRRKPVMSTGRYMLLLLV